VSCRARFSGLLEVGEEGAEDDVESRLLRHRIASSGVLPASRLRR
jgi:hypothetical protein